MIEHAPALVIGKIAAEFPLDLFQLTLMLVDMAIAAMLLRRGMGGMEREELPAGRV
jgi:hypothetical protein